MLQTMKKGNIMKTIVAVGLCLTATITTKAQDVKVEGYINGTAPEGLRIFVSPVDDAAANSDTVHIEGNTIKATTKSSKWSIYRLIATTKTRQTLMPVAMKADNGKARIDIAIADGKLKLKADDEDNKALTAYNDFYLKNVIQLWEKGSSMDSISLRNSVLSFLTVADSIVNCHSLTSDVADYIRLWASVVTYEALENLKHSSGRTAAQVGLQGQDFTSRLYALIDCDMAASFMQTARMALASLPDGTLEQRLNSLYSRYANPQVRKKATELLLSRHISSFPYATRYDEGLAELTALTEKYSIPKHFVNDFKTRRASVAGVPFPKGIKFLDLEGREVSMEQFKGKYVYIDMWASWCVPCIKQIPHLQQLEKEMHGGNVVFVSLSIDRNEKAWKQKVNELKLTGNQFIDKENKLSEALNVKGIPFFVIYDKEGKLYRYNAPRPSDARIKPLLESLK